MLRPRLWKIVHKGVTPIMHNTHMRNVKKIENSSIDLFRGRNSWSKSCKFHCFINFADKKGFPNIVKQCFKRGSDCIYWHPRSPPPPETPPYERGTPLLVLSPTSALVHAFGIGVRNTKKKSWLRPWSILQRIGKLFSFSHLCNPGDIWIV